MAIKEFDPARADIGVNVTLYTNPTCRMCALVNPQWDRLVADAARDAAAAAAGGGGAGGGAAARRRRARARARAHVDCAAHLDHCVHRLEVHHIPVVRATSSDGKARTLELRPDGVARDVDALIEALAAPISLTSSSATRRRATICARSCARCPRACARSGRRARWRTARGPRT